MVSPEFILASREEDEYFLEKLHYWLKWGSGSASMVVALFWIPYGMVLMVVNFLAVIFAPYLLVRLVQARRFKAVAVFVIVVLLPFAISRIVGAGSSMSFFFLSVFPLVAYYFYLWILTMQIGEYLSQQRAIRKMDYDRATKQLMKTSSDQILPL